MKNCSCHKKAVDLFPARASVVMLFILAVTTLPLIVTNIGQQTEITQFAAVLSGPPPASGKQFTTLPPGSTLPTGADCTNRVRRTTWEPRPTNTDENQFVPVKGTDFNVPRYNGSDQGIWIGDHPQRANVFVDRLDGNFKGTTDEVIQWAACKWGLDEDMARAQAVVESNWDMAANGDNGESFGLLQVRITAHAGAFQAARKSTAFNADYTFMRWRMCYEGLVDYLAQTGPYVAGDQWGCMGVWYTGNWYGSGGGGSASGAQAYIDAVKAQLNARVWQTWTGTQISAAPTAGITQSPTGTQTGTRVNMNLLLHGIGKGGDNVNPGATGNMSPRRPQRNVTVELFNSQNQLAGTRQGLVVFNATSGNFTGTIDVGTLATGVYTMKVKSQQFLKRTLPGIITITAGQATTLPALSLVTGDANNDNAISIFDYNMLLDCFSDLTPARSCTDANKKLMTDLTDDGNVNQFDYNLFLRELSVQCGDVCPAPTRL